MPLTGCGSAWRVTLSIGVGLCGGRRFSAKHLAFGYPVLLKMSGGGATRAARSDTPHLFSAHFCDARRRVKAEKRLPPQRLSCCFGVTRHALPHPANSLRRENTMQIPLGILSVFVYPQLSPIFLGNKIIPVNGLVIPPSGFNSLRAF